MSSCSLRLVIADMTDETAFAAQLERAPPRAAGPLLPHARLVRRGRGPGAGDVPARVAQARRLRGPRVGPRLAVQDRHQRLPRPDRGATSAACADRRELVAEVPWLAAVPGRPARRGRAERRRAGRGRRRAGDDRAGLPRRDPAPAAAPARGADPARRARLVGEARPPSCSRRASPSANSALQRARAELQEHLPASRAETGRRASRAPSERELLARFMDAHESGDTVRRRRMLREDVRVTMPPLPQLYDGIDALGRCWSARSARPSSASGSSCRRA